MLSYYYYLDESGNSGDLIGRTPNLIFGNQPIFTLSCIGIEDYEKVESFISGLRSKYELGTGELKSSEIYFEKPEIFLELARFISKERLPLLVELVDKKYCVATSIVNHHIMPPYYMPDESDGRAQYIRNGLADYLTANLPDGVYRSFFKACKQPTEENLLSSMSELKSFFEGEKQKLDFAELTVKSIDETIDDYRIMKSRIGERAAIEKFVPLPDLTAKGVKVNLLPHVHSIFNLIARLNKYHLKNISDVTLFHDKQKDFDHILMQCKEYLETTEVSENIPPVVNSDFDLNESLSLEFVDSEDCVGVQVADLLAGFFNRYVNGLLYKEVDVNEIYHSIFSEFRRNFRPMSPLGVNVVIPASKQQIIFRKFNF